MESRLPVSLFPIYRQPIWSELDALLAIWEITAVAECDGNQVTKPIMQRDR